MKATLDADGRLLLPAEIRQQAGLQPGMELEITWRDGRIEIEPAYLPVKLVRDGPLLVAVPLRPVPPLTSDVVEATRQALLEEYESGL
jgi:AbrB family looped-hinge helix DNA binding protein